MTAREAVSLYSKFYDKPRPWSELAPSFALDGLADRRFEELSVGQRQRVGLALAFLPNPRLVILDEPTAGLDPTVRRELHSLIRRERREGIAIVMSTHDLTEAAELSDRVLVLHRGRILREATPRDLVASSGGPRRLRVATSPPLSRDDVEGFPGVASLTPEGEGWLITTDQPEQLVAVISNWVSASNAELRELALLQPTLEEAFFRLIGEEGG